MKLIINPNWIGSMCVNSDGSFLTKEQIRQYSKLITDKCKAEQIKEKEEKDEDFIP